MNVGESSLFFTKNNCSTISIKKSLPIRHLLSYKKIQEYACEFNLITKIKIMRQ